MIHSHNMKFFWVVQRKAVSGRCGSASGKPPPLYCELQVLVRKIIKGSTVPVHRWRGLPNRKDRMRK